MKVDIIYQLKKAVDKGIKITSIMAVFLIPLFGMGYCVYYYDTHPFCIEKKRYTESHILSGYKFRHIEKFEIDIKAKIDGSWTGKSYWSGYLWRDIPADSQSAFEDSISILKKQAKKECKRLNEEYMKSKNPSGSIWYNH